MEFIQWIVVNEKLISICIAFSSLVMTSFLTFLIIKQTKKLNRHQLEIEESINRKQIEMQKKQICVDSYPYKREIYCYVSAVLELCHHMRNLLKSVNLYSKNPTEILEFFKILQEQWVPDRKQALWSMREAEYVLPENISAAIIDIRKNYDSMCAHITAPASISKVLTTQEMETHIEEIKRLNINEAIACCNRIVKHTSFIESVMPVELNISKLSK